jgi:CheY-like chemotaxis protein
MFHVGAVPPASAMNIDALEERINPTNRRKFIYIQSRRHLKLMPAHYPQTKEKPVSGKRWCDMITPYFPSQEKSTDLRKEAIKKRILLVESGEDHRLVMALLLKEEGHQVSTCSDVSAAIDLIEREPFDFAIVEHSAPVLDGLSLLEEIRRRSLRTQVLLIAAQYEIEPYLVAMNLGALDFFSKPIDYGEIQRLIKTYG